MATPTNTMVLTPGGYRLTPLYDVMSAAPYPEFAIQKVKLAMAIGDKGYYRLSQIQLRHFYQTGKRTGLSEQDMDNLLSDMSTRIEDAITEAAALATDAGMPESTSSQILEGARKRAGMIGVAKE